MLTRFHLFGQRMARHLTMEMAVSLQGSSDSIDTFSEGAADLLLED
jgi:hypothetical protein